MGKVDMQNGPQVPQRAKQIQRDKKPKTSGWPKTRHVEKCKGYSPCGNTTSGTSLLKKQMLHFLYVI